VLELVRGVYELGHGDPVRRRTAFEHIGRSPDSSTSYALNAAANSGYEVIIGGKNAPYLRLTDAGERLGKAREGAEQLRAAHDILFANSFFSALVEKYNDRPLPPDSIAIDYLQREHGLNAEDAKACWTTAKENMNDFGLFEESGGKRVIISREHALSDVERRSGATAAPAAATPEHGVASDSVGPERTTALAEPRTAPPATKIVPQIAFNIQVVLPETGSAETYDAIFRSMAVHLLGRGDA
jgi:hypothetical protein